MKKQDEFAIVVSTLPDYVEQNSGDLIVRSLFAGKTADLIRSEGNLMTGVKSQEAVNLLDTDAIFQDGSGCARTASGTTNLTQRIISVGTIAVVEDICVSNLEKKYIATKIAKGAMVNKLPFEQEYSELKANTVARQLEIAIWQGDTASGNPNLNKFDGFIKIIAAASGVITASGTGVTAGAALTATNAKASVDSLWMSLPADVQGKDDVRVFIGWDDFQVYIASYRDQNLFNFAPSGKEVTAANGEVIIPGTNYKLTAVHGLDGTHHMYAARMSNLVEATDLESDWETFVMKEDQFDDYLRFKMRFRFGVQIGFPDQIVKY
jgi:hypothetical protein